jgi:hypothetical protein
VPSLPEAGRLIRFLTHGISARLISVAVALIALAPFPIFTLASTSPPNTTAETLYDLPPTKYESGDTVSFAFSTKIRVGLPAPLERETNETSLNVMPRPSEGPASLASSS